jgi:hypothetical protein
VSTVAKDDGRRREVRYLRLLVANIWQRKSEFFVGLVLSVLTGAGTAWLQYREGMLDERHLWDGVVTTAIPVLGIVLVFGLFELCRAAVLVHRGQEQLLASQLELLGSPKERLPPFIEVAYVERFSTYVSEYTEEEFFEREDFFTFRNVGNEIVRKLTVEPFRILGRNHTIATIPSLVPGDPPAERRTKLDKLRDANVALRAFHKTPVGVRINIAYYGAGDSPHHFAQYNLIYDQGAIRVEPAIGEDGPEYLEASDDPREHE